MGHKPFGDHPSTQKKAKVEGWSREKWMVAMKNWDQYEPQTAKFNLGKHGDVVLK